MTAGKTPDINVFSQFVALLYKELLLRKYHYVGTSFEVILPTIIVCVYCILYNGLMNVADSRKRFEFEWVNFTTYQPMEVTDIYRVVRTDDVEFVYTPSNEVTDELMEDSVRTVFRRTGGNQATRTSSERGDNIMVSETGKNVKKTDSEEELRKYILQVRKMDEEKLLIGTVFKGFGDTFPEDLDYKIYYTGYFDTRNKYKLNGPETPNVYSDSFLLRWQAAVGDTFIKVKSAEHNKRIDYKISLQMFPYPEYKRTPLGNIYISPYGLYLCLIFFAAVVMKRIIEGKNDGSKEIMESMGMTKFTYWASTFTINFITAFIIILVFTVINKTYIKYPLFQVQSDFMLLFVLLLLYVANLILFCMAFSIFFNRVAFAFIALMTVQLLSQELLSWVMDGGMSHEEYFSLSLFHKLCICIYPDGALRTFILIMGLFESGNEGVQWRNLTEYPMIPDINMLMVIATMIFSCFLYIAAIWCLDAVWPWQPGVREPFYFFLRRSYWFGEAPDVSDEMQLVRNENSFHNFEEEPRSTVSSVVIKDLSKDIQQGSISKLILHDVSLRCYQGQITVLLGHSEAGKTSLINILAGKELPTKGSASITGLDVATSMTRKLLGVCPQQSVLYEELSVEQHLKLYAAMKGIALAQLTFEIHQVLISLKMSRKKAEMLSNLSYAEKRKLSLAIAIVGNSRVLLLDEPTYGMDSEAKRHVWDALQALKHDRTVIVTTQSCEEADILGDRIVVMAEGEIHGCGTSSFIKQKLGAGYHLHVLKDVNFDLQGLLSLIAKHVSPVTFENDSLKEVSFNLGAGKELGDLFEELDRRKIDLGIISYDVSLSTLRDVLLTVSNMSRTNQSLSTGGASGNTSTETEEVNKISTHPALHASLDNQFRALLLKHFHYCKRRWKFHIIQLAVPSILMLVCFYFMKYIVDAMSSYQPLKLDISSVYGTTDGFYYSNDPTLSNLAETFKSGLESNDVTVEKVSEPTHYVLNYGGKDIAKYLKRLVVGGAFDSFPNGSLNLTAWYNSGSIHSMPLSLLLMQTALLRNITNTGSMSLGIVPVIPIGNGYNKHIYSLISWRVVPFLPLAFTFLSLSFILAPTHEKATGVKLLQLMSGFPAAMYWIAIFLWDCLIYFVVCIFLIMDLAFVFPALFFGSHLEAIGTFLVFLLLYGWASLPLGYIVSRYLKRENRGLFIFIVFCIFSSVVTPFFYPLDHKIPYGSQYGSWFFRLFPLHSFTRGVLYNFQIALQNAECDIFTPEDLARCGSASQRSSPTLLRCCKDICTENCHTTMNHFSWKSQGSFPGNGPEALYLGLEGIVFFAILFLLEIRADISDDPQVLQEEERIRNLTATQKGSGGEALFVSGLTQRCGTFCSFNRLTFGVNGEESFGILGVNGAGKTSTFRMLTGVDMPWKGNAFIQRYSLKGDFRKFRSHIGYCPEVDPLMDDLTGREMLLLFGQLRGLRGQELQKNLNDLIQSLGLTNCADEPTQFYNRGDKRRLSVAIALIGSPPVILLDEPTAGVGPESRRQIWEVLTRFRKRTGAAILLATESIEECEALCSRLAIMVNGRCRCLGTAEQLKYKYGQGYLVTIKISKGQQRNAETVHALKNLMQNSLKNKILTDDYRGILQNHVVDMSMTVGQLFKLMSDVKEQFDLEDYSIDAISLEHILLAYSRA